MCMIVSSTPSHSFKLSEKKVYVSNGAGYIIINKESDLKNQGSIPQEIPIEIVIGEDKTKLITRVIEYKHNYRIFISTSIMRTLIKVYKLSEESLVADVELKFEPTQVSAKIKIEDRR